MLVLHELLDFLRGDLPLSVGLVAHQNKDSVGVGVALNLIDPVIPNIQKGIAHRQIKDQEHSMRIYVSGKLLL